MKFFDLEMGNTMASASLTYPLRLGCPATYMEPLTDPRCKKEWEDREKETIKSK